MVDSVALAELTVQVPKQAVAQIEDLAAKTGQSTSDLVGEALASFLEYQAWKLTAVSEALAASKAGEPTIDHARMVEWLNSWGTDDELPAPESEATHPI